MGDAAADFRKLVQQVIDGGTPLDEIASTLQVMRSTVRRWADGTVLPHEGSMGEFVNALYRMLDDNQNAVRVAEQATGED